MIKFLLKGLLRERSRSLIPILVVAIGVMLSVFLYCYLLGLMSDMIDFNARFATGHIKIMTKAYAENQDQNPNDLALIGTGSLIDSLYKEHAENPDLKALSEKQNFPEVKESDYFLYGIIDNVIVEDH